jgi:hypothetical protein
MVSYASSLSWTPGTVVAVEVSVMREGQCAEEFQAQREGSQILSQW